jgi:hypothetical protein
MRMRVLLAVALLASGTRAQPAPLSGFPDEGAFFLYWNEEHVVGQVRARYRNSMKRPEMLQAGKDLQIRHRPLAYRASPSRRAIG